MASDRFYIYLFANWYCLIELRFWHDFTYSFLAAFFTAPDSVFIACLFRLMGDSRRNPAR